MRFAKRVRSNKDDNINNNDGSEVLAEVSQKKKIFQLASYHLSD